ncbi:phospholipase B1, membrane-associated-like [Amphiura filiformis]|uniref:phospholipase B1, membrane-associated-like n=1 Tax=Amphiura filiformis TaxID=82378 RepID=UPI003B2133E0
MLTSLAVILVLCCLNSGQSLHSKEWQSKVEETVKKHNIVPSRDLSDIIDKLPGIDCSVKPDWPGPRFNFDFSCDVLQPSDKIPTSVHRLRPSDIKVIAAIGDSLTAASGAMACFLPELLYEYRGRTFSHGGDISFEKNPTLANIFRKYNPDLKGYGNSTGPWDSVNAGMNVGEPGAKAYETVQQARNLVEKMKLTPSIDYENDWKLVTLFIGGNDICDWCNDVEFFHPDMFVDYIRQTLTILHDEMPRTFVNVISPLQVDAMRVLRSEVCDIFHYIFCPCVINVDDKQLIKAQQTTEAYQRQLGQLINSGYFDGKEDFTVVLQPFFEETVVPVLEDGSPDYTYFAPDCFHLSSKGHASAGQELWNNMESPYLYTNINSELYDMPLPTDDPVNMPLPGTAARLFFNVTNIVIVAILQLLIN